MEANPLATGNAVRKQFWKKLLLPQIEKLILGGPDLGRLTDEGRYKKTEEGEENPLSSGI